MSLRVAINGFGRIGRLTLRAALKQSLPFEVVAIAQLHRRWIINDDDGRAHG